MAVELSVMLRFRFEARVFRGIAELLALPKGLKWPKSGWQIQLRDLGEIAFGAAIP